MSEQPRIVVSLRTSEYRGDHAADVVRHFDLLPGETVAGLVARVKLQPPDWVELRLTEAVARADRAQPEEE